MNEPTQDPRKPWTKPQIVVTDAAKKTESGVLTKAGVESTNNTYKPS